MKRNAFEKEARLQAGEDEDKFNHLLHRNLKKSAADRYLSRESAWKIISQEFTINELANAQLSAYHRSMVLDYYFDDLLSGLDKNLVWKIKEDLILSAFMATLSSLKTEQSFNTKIKFSSLRDQNLSSMLTLCRENFPLLSKTETDYKITRNPKTSERTKRVPESKKWKIWCKCCQKPHKFNLECQIYADMYKSKKR